jgi:hypothetical protein
MATVPCPTDIEPDHNCEQEAVEVPPSAKLHSDYVPNFYRYSSKPSQIDSSRMSLNSMLGRTSSPRKISFNLQSSRINKAVDFESATSNPVLGATRTTSEVDIDYGYGSGYGPGKPGDDLQSISEAGMKRRRYQRRNSKTPQMLAAMTSSLRSYDFMKELERSERDCSILERVKSDSSIIGAKATDNPHSSSFHNDLDGGLAIAEELVMQLQKRMKNHR